MNGSSDDTDDVLGGRRIALVGKLESMPRREAERLIRERGGRVVEFASGADLIVVRDEALKRESAESEGFDEEFRARLASGDVELIGESVFWARLGLVESGQGVERLYTPAMLAELVRAPVSAIRQWHRRGVLCAKREVRRLPYFDFEEVGVARKLAQLLSAGCGFSTIHRRLAELARLLPGSPRPLADPAVVVAGRRLYVRRDEGLAEPSGQLLIDFDGGTSDTGSSAPSQPVSIPLSAGELLGTSAGDGAAEGAERPATEDLRTLAAELDERGRSSQAIDVYRAILVSGDFTADDQFALAELLYRAGDLPAARERYFVAIELDEDFVEARSNLGCVLTELGETRLAEAAFRGALEYHPDYADAHYHLARLLDQQDRAEEAARHWRLFMNLAPASPWADEARERVMGEDGERALALGFGPQEADTTE